MGPGAAVRARYGPAGSRAHRIARLHTLRTMEMVTAGVALVATVIVICQGLVALNLGRRIRLDLEKDLGIMDRLPEGGSARTEMQRVILKNSHRLIVKETARRTRWQWTFYLLTAILLTPPLSYSYVVANYTANELDDGMTFGERIDAAYKLTYPPAIEAYGEMTSPFGVAWVLLLLLYLALNANRLEQAWKLRRRLRADSSWDPPRQSVTNRSATATLDREATTTVVAEQSGRSPLRAIATLATLCWAAGRLSVRRRE
jgi:hypothetical protein